MRRKLSLTVKTDDVTKGRKDLDPHGRLRPVTGGSGANGLKLFIQSSKTDQSRDGAWIVIASFGKTTCPVAMMSRYLERARLS